MREPVTPPLPRPPTVDGPPVGGTELLALLTRLLRRPRRGDRRLPVLWLVRAWRGQSLRIVLAPAWWWGIGALLLIFTVVRNLPFGSALAP